MSPLHKCSARKRTSLSFCKNSPSVKMSKNTCTERKVGRKGEIWECNHNPVMSSQKFSTQHVKLAASLPHWSRSLTVQGLVEDRISVGQHTLQSHFALLVIKAILGMTGKRSSFCRHCFWKDGEKVIQKITKKWTCRNELNLRVQLRIKHFLYSKAYIYMETKCEGLPTASYNGCAGNKEFSNFRAQNLSPCTYTWNLACVTWLWK